MTRYRVKTATALLFGLAVVVAPASTVAQRLIPGDRPADERPEAPPFESSEPERGPILPPFPIPKDPTTESLGGPTRVFVRKIEISGNTAIDDEALRRIASLYEDRTLGFAELLELRDRLTLTYVDRGFLTSGAVIPPQDVSGGVVRIEIVEGSLLDLDIETDGRFRTSYFESRLTPREPGPVNIYETERRLQILQHDPRIRRIDAQLAPSTTRGQAALRVRVLEASPYSVSAATSNDRNPTIGSYGGELQASYANTIGIGDEIFVRGEFSEGLRQVEARVSVPVTVWDTLLSVRYRYSEADIVSNPIADVFDIESRSQTIGVELRQPLHRSSLSTLETFVRGELRRSKSELDGQGFSFTQGTDNGRSNVSALRWGLEWTVRSRVQALAFRSTVSFGLDALNATRNVGDTPDARYVGWLGQVQWARRLPSFDTEILARFDLQLVNDPILPLEQFAIGGRYTVRGYRENTLVRDNGLVGSFEIRQPIYRRVEPRIEVALVPFIDVGHSWNTDRETFGDETLLSVGLGTRIQLTRFTRLEAYWGHSVLDVPQVGDYDLQDDGLHFRLTATWP